MTSEFTLNLINLRLIIFNMSVWHFSYELDDDYTALYKGKLIEQLPEAFISVSIIICNNVWLDLFYSAWGLEIP